MTATAVFVEILFAGVQSIIWIVLILMGLYGVDPAQQVLQSVLGAEGLLFIILFALAYTLGIINDRMARWCFSYIPNKLLDKCNPSHYFEKKQILDVDPPKQHDRMKILASEGKVTELLDFIRSRVRIARATAFNVPIIMMASLFFIWKQHDKFPHSDTELTSPIGIALAVIGIGFVVECAAIAAFSMLLENYNRRKEQAVELCR